MGKRSFISTDGNSDHPHKRKKETTPDSKQPRDFIRMRPSEKSEGESQLHGQPRDNRTEIGAASKKQFHISKAVDFLVKQIGRPSFKEMVPSRKSGADPLAKPEQEHANESSLETPPQDTEKIPEIKKIGKMFDLDYTVVDPRMGELVIPQWMCAFVREDLKLQRLSERLDPDKYRQLTHSDGSVLPQIHTEEKANKGTGTKNFIEENKLSKLIACGDDKPDIDMIRPAQQMKSQMQLDDYTFIAVEWPLDMHNSKTPEELNWEEQTKKKVNEAATFTVGGMPDLRNIFKQVSIERRRYVLRDYVRGSVGSSLKWLDVEQRKTVVPPRSGDRLKASLDEPAYNACQFERKAARKMMGRWWHQMARVPYLKENQVSLQYLVVPPRSGEPLSLAEEIDH